MGLDLLDLMGGLGGSLSGYDMSLLMATRKEVSKVGGF